MHAAGCLDFELQALNLFTLPTHQNLRFQLKPRAMARHAKIRPPMQKSHHPTGRSFIARNHLKPLHPQNLLSNSPKPRTMDIEEGINLPETNMSSCWPREMGAPLVKSLVQPKSTMWRALNGNLVCKCMLTNCAGVARNLRKMTKT